MAWTAPRTWTTGETVTAALLNTHVRDNMLQAAPAKVTTAGDIVYATGANALARLAIGTSAKFLRGGASTPAWTNQLDGQFKISTTSRQLIILESDAADPLDAWILGHSGTSHTLEFFDDSASTFTESLHVDKGDFILHTGDKATGVGAVVIGTDESSGSESIITSGAVVLTVSITTGGPAYVTGHYSINVQRINTGVSGDTISIIPRNDGANMHGSFQVVGDWAEHNIPNTGDSGTFSGTFYERFTGTDTSAWQLFIEASSNSVFTVTTRMIVTSVQYPT